MIRKLCSWFLAVAGLWIFTLHVPATVYYVNVNNPAPAAPFSTWDTAATNIQDAIDLTSTGDSVLVTNGVYTYGGRVMTGDLVNRVALTNAITVQSVNGPWVTAILGAGATNGATAVRCAWLTNGAALSGFTLRGGATRLSGNAYTLESGGGAWCASSNAVIGNCVLTSNTACDYGGAVYQGTVINSLICSNGGASPLVGAAYGAVLKNCTIVSNTTYGVAYPPAMTNCIIYYNSSYGNCMTYGGTFAYCCTIPSLTGTGNFTNAPQLFPDCVHLANSSPCVGAGAVTATGTDIFGQTWSNPPAVGCAEWQSAPVVSQPHLYLTSDPAGASVGNAMVSGQFPLTFAWLKDGSPLHDNGHFTGTQTTNLAVTGITFADAGAYQLVASNSFGAATSTVAPLVIHCVDVNGAGPAAPYLTWATAATNIQDAITAAAVNEVVLVTNGLYATGGISMDGAITNRVSVNKAILVQSVNGANTTIIQGAWDASTTNGAGAIRCAWLTTNAIMSGFTLCGGATRTISSPYSGGGVFGMLSNSIPVATVANCLITGNAAGYAGGGAYGVNLNYCTIATNFSSRAGGGAEGCYLKNCFIANNSANDGNGGGTDNCKLRNCALTKNTSYLSGAAAYGGSLINCTATANLGGVYTSGYGAAVYGAVLTNCIVYGNFSAQGYPSTNYASCTMAYSCTDPLPSGTGNMDVDPQILGDGIHLAAASPCIGAGLASVVAGTDIDGQSWSNSPSIGCDEWHPEPIIGSKPTFLLGTPSSNLKCTAVVAGGAPMACFWSKDGVLIQDDGRHSNSGTPSLTLNSLSPDDGGVYQLVVTNFWGAATSQVAQLVIHAVNAAGANPIAPYTSWATAATSIQDAIDAAAAGEIVLVTNGIYATGGRVITTGLLNRVALDKAITVTSVNGYAATTIQGAWDPDTTNGAAAVRCAYLADGATLSGFTLANGATCAAITLVDGPLESGGGVYCLSTNGVVWNCVLSNNCAIYGGGAANGMLNNCLVENNKASSYGGGTYAAALNNCTVSGNYIMGVFPHGAGIYAGTARNSIVVGNYDFFNGMEYYLDNYSMVGSSSIAYSCTSPTTTGSGNINATPQFISGFHIAASSPCRGAGSPVYASGTDLDGESWASSPAMGCDEVVASNLVGALSAQLIAYTPNPLVGHYSGFSGKITGSPSATSWNFSDGTILTNVSGAAHHWTNSGDYPVTFTAFNYDYPAGVSAATVIHVQPLNPPQMMNFGMVNGAWQFQFAAQTDATYTVQYSTNLSQSDGWQTLNYIYYNQNAMVQINDSNCTNDARFYRVLVQ